MAYKIERRSADEQRIVLRAMATDKTALSRISATWRPGGFASPDAELVATWCVDYYGKHGKAPRAALTPIYAAWSESHHDQERVKGVGKVLSFLSDEHERSAKLDPSYVLELANRLFARNRITKHQELVQGFLEAGKIEEAEQALTQYVRVEAGMNAGVHPLNDESVMESCFDAEAHEPLFSFGQKALDTFFAHMLQREKLVACLAGEKMGKTHVLLDMAVRAVAHRRKTVFFACGDMTEREMLERLYPRVARHPLLSADGSWPYTVRVPTSVRPAPRPDKKEEGDKTREIPLPEVEFREKTFDRPLSVEQTKKACSRFIQNKVRSRDEYFKLACYPNDTISAKGVHEALKQWEVQGWVPDVVVIDYADILAPIDKRRETRDQHNETWKYLRRISQEMHCLLLTATQADAASYGKRRLDRTNFSEDKRKLAHASGIFGIAMSLGEKELQVARWNWIVKRTGRSSPLWEVYVAGCLDLCDPCVVSTF